MELYLGAVGWMVYKWVFLACALGASTTLLAKSLLVVPAVHRRFWCVGARRPVEVVFNEYRLPGWRRPSAVLSCSVFDPCTDVRCTRDCVLRVARVPLKESALAGELASRNSGS